MRLHMDYTVSLGTIIHLVITVLAFIGSLIGFYIAIESRLVKSEERQTYIIEQIRDIKEWQKDVTKVFLRGKYE